MKIESLVRLLEVKERIKALKHNIGWLSSTATYNGPALAARIEIIQWGQQRAKFGIPARLRGEILQKIADELRTELRQLECLVEELPEPDFPDEK